MAADDRLNGPESPEELARRLREAHRRVGLLAIPDADRERMARRLVAICDTAKRDLQHASARLSVFLEDLAGLESGTPRSKNVASGD